jgi:aerobic carbon-monoxide dehydrogenase small subunit
MQKTVSLTVNGKPVSATVEGRTLLVQLLREQLGLTGTHVGCDTSQCGACVVHVDGEAVKSCTLLALQAEGHSVLTIEGVATGETLHPMQEAFRNNHALQCGFCTPGSLAGGVSPRITAAPSAIASTAAAEIAFEVFADLAFGRIRVVFDQVKRTHHHATQTS